jgi:hypothetical protein
MADQDNVVKLIPECILTDVNGVQHHKVSYPIGQQTSGKNVQKHDNARCANLMASNA